MWSRRKPDEQKRSAGFILVEVLVTAAVAAVLLAALLRAFSTVWSGIGAVREETDAMLVARAVIEASTPRHNLVPLTQQGTSGRYAWTISIASTGIQMAQSAPEGQNQGAAPVAPTGAPGQANQNRPQTTGDENAAPGNNPNGDEPTNQEPPWALFKIAVAVRAPSGRRTTLETFRLSRPIAR
jgi:Tfp pilus assembly protein PilE